MYIYICTPDVFLSKVIRFLSIMAKNASYHVSLKFTVAEYAQLQRKNLPNKLFIDTYILCTDVVMLHRCFIDISISQTKIQCVRVYDVG